MTSEKGLYWIAVGFLALIVTNNLVVKRESTGHIADRSLNAAQQLAGRGTRYLSSLETVVGIKQSECPRTQVAMARAQTRLATLQTVIAREQTGMARLETQKARVMTLRNMKHAELFLPRNMKTDMKIEAPEAPDPQDDGSL